MAKDDYHVIVYQILAYLYVRLKNGKEIEPIAIEADSPLFDKGINKKYWAYIMYNLQKYDFVEGVIFSGLDGEGVPYPVSLEDCIITPRGIEYLCDNSFMEKAKRFLKDVKGITPFI